MIGDAATSSRRADRTLISAQQCRIVPKSHRNGFVTIPTVIGISFPDRHSILTALQLSEEAFFEGGGIFAPPAAYLDKTFIAT